jgi:hypothetical protein
VKWTNLEQWSSTADAIRDAKVRRFRVQGSGFRVQGPGFRVQDSGFRVQGARLSTRNSVHALRDGSPSLFTTVSEHTRESRRQRRVRGANDASRRLLLSTRPQ